MFSSVCHNTHMQVTLNFEIDCDVESAWRAIHSPDVAAQLYGPFLEMQPVTKLPEKWESGLEAKVAMRAFGLFSAGTQLIRIDDREITHEDTPVKIMRDSGRPLTGALAALKTWNHQMAVSPVHGSPGRTLWRDRLVFTGLAAPLYWPVLWTVWNLRTIRIKQLAPTWQ